MRAKNELKFIAETYEQVLKENISGERWGEEWDFSKFSPQLNQAIAEFENELTTEGGIDVIGLKDIVDEIHSANVLHGDIKKQAIGYLRQRAEAAGLEEFDLYGEEGIFAEVIKKTSEDNEYGYRETRPDTPPDREWKEEDPWAGEPDDDREPDDDDSEKWHPEFPALSQKSDSKVRVQELDDEIVAMQKAAMKRKKSTREKDFDKRVAQTYSDFRGEDNETRAQKAKQKELEARRKGFHDDVLKHVKGPHNIYKK